MYRRTVAEGWDQVNRAQTGYRKRTPQFAETGFVSGWSADIPVRTVLGDYNQTSEQPGYGDPSNGEFKSLAVLLRFLRFLLFSPQKATKRTKKKGIGSAFLQGPFGHFF
jgi:hypothetical protein